MQVYGIRSVGVGGVGLRICRLAYDIRIFYIIRWLSGNLSPVSAPVSGETRSVVQALLNGYLAV